MKSQGVHHDGRDGRGAVQLAWLLDHELRLALRYRRNVSLVLLSEARGKLRLGVLEDLIRRSDEIFLLRGDAALLMTETGKDGALKAIERFREACLGQYDLRAAVVSFPGDGNATGVLLKAAHRRLGRALQSPRERVVASD